MAEVSFMDGRRGCLVERALNWDKFPAQPQARVILDKSPNLPCATSPHLQNYDDVFLQICREDKTQD